MKSMFFASLIFAGFAAQAVPLANDMTCEQAQAYYAANGRVYVETRMGDVVPVYGDHRACGTGEEANAVWVRTTDTNTCEVGYRCRTRNRN